MDDDVIFRHRHPADKAGFALCGDFDGDVPKASKLRPGAGGAQEHEEEKQEAVLHWQGLTLAKVAWGCQEQIRLSLSSQRGFYSLRCTHTLLTSPRPKKITKTKEPL